MIVSVIWIGMKAHVCHTDVTQGTFALGDNLLYHVSPSPSHKNYVNLLVDVLGIPEHLNVKGIMTVIKL